MGNKSASALANVTALRVAGFQLAEAIQRTEAELSSGNKGVRPARFGVFESLTRPKPQVDCHRLLNVQLYAEPRELDDRIITDLAIPVLTVRKAKSRPIGNFETVSDEARPIGSTREW